MWRCVPHRESTIESHVGEEGCKHSPGCSECPFRVLGDGSWDGALSVTWTAEEDEASNHAGRVTRSEKGLGEKVASSISYSYRSSGDSPISG